MTDSLARQLLLAPLLFLAVLAGAAACRVPATDGAAKSDASSPLPAGGEGMEPRIITEHPVDAPGRPAAVGPPATAALEPAPAASWIPQLAVADLETSADFYRDLGFAVTGREPADGPARRLLLSRDGARLVLVAAELPGRPTEGAEADRAEDDRRAAPATPPLVLHFVADDEDSAERTVVDPDGHRLGLPDPG